MLPIPGTINSIDNLCSHYFHVSNDKFVQHLNTKFPLQQSLWLLQVPCKMLSELISLLSHQMLPWASQHPEPTRQVTCGITGATSVLHSTWWMRCSPQLMTCPHPPSYNHMPAATTLAGYLPAAILDNLEQWKVPFMPLDIQWLVGEPDLWLNMISKTDFHLP